MHKTHLKILVRSLLNTCLLLHTYSVFFGTWSATRSDYAGAQVTLGTSPGTGFVGSPDSLGMQSLTLEHLKRPYPDRESKVGAGPQATLRGSPRATRSGSKLGTWGPAAMADGVREGCLASDSLTVSGKGERRGAAEGVGGGEVKATTSEYRELFTAHDGQVGVGFGSGFLVGGVGAVLYLSRISVF